MRVALNYLNLAILREIAAVAARIADRGDAIGNGLLETHDYVDADTVTMVLHEIRERLGDMDEYHSHKEG